MCVLGGRVIHFIEHLLISKAEIERQTETDRDLPFTGSHPKIPTVCASSGQN